MKRDHPHFTLALLYARQVSSGLIIYQPIFIPFLISRGMSMMDVAYLQTAYNLGVLALSIPSGYFADRFGRKWALALSNASLAAGTALIAFGHSLPTFILAELFYAQAVAIEAGTHSAYLFEWLRKQGREKQYYRYDALGTFLFLAIGATGTWIAGIYAEKDLALPVIATIVLTSIGIPAAFLLPNDLSRANTPRGKSAPPHIGFSGIFRIIRKIFATPGLRWALGVAVIWLWSRQYVNLIISQPYFKSIDLKLKHFGMLYAIMTLASGMIALFSRRLIQKPDLRAVAALGLLAIPASFGIMGFTPNTWGLSGFFLFSIPYGLCTAITNTLLNRQFSDHDNRATFLSTIDFFVRLTASALVLGLGWILAHHGAQTALKGAMLISGFVALSLLPGVFRFARTAPKAVSG